MVLPKGVKYSKILKREMEKYKATNQPTQLETLVKLRQEGDRQKVEAFYGRLTTEKKKELNRAYNRMSESDRKDYIRDIRERRKEQIREIRGSRATLKELITGKKKYKIGSARKKWLKQRLGKGFERVVLKEMLLKKGRVPSPQQLRTLYPKPDTRGLKQEVQTWQRAEQEARQQAQGVNMLQRPSVFHKPQTQTIMGMGSPRTNNQPRKSSPFWK